MAFDNRATSNQDDSKRVGMIQNILNNVSNSNFGQGFGQSFNLDSEDKRDALFARREAEGKASIPPRYQQTLSQHPLIDTIRQYASTTDNKRASEFLSRVGLGEFNDGMYSFRANNGLNVGGSPTESERLPDLEFDESTQKVRQPTEQEVKRIEKDKQRVRDLPKATKAGHLLGGMANDFVSNQSRSLWWLLNAPQAVVDVTSEALVAHMNPDLYREETIDLQDAIDQNLVKYSPDYDQGAVNKAVSQRQNLSEPLPDLTGEAAQFGGYTRAGQEADRKALEDRVKEELYSKDNPKNYKRSAPGVRVRFDKGAKQFQVRRRAFSPMLVNVASMLPAAIGVNAGIGLMGSEDSGPLTFGRQAGYEAAVADELDPRKSSNAIFEIGKKYILGREGKLMNQDDFLLERPDVTSGEYAQYKNYLRSRDADVNFLDGDFNVAGILKGTTDGIRGAEINFLGKSMGVNDTGIPVLSSLAGSALGALAGRSRRLRGSKAAVIGALAGGGTAGLVGGQLTGAALEDQRRRSNFEERNPGVDYDIYKANAKQLFDKKVELAKANPNAEQEMAESKVGFSKRNQQQALQTKALQQQTLVDQLLQGESKARAEKALGTQQWALDKSSAIDEEIRKRREGISEQPMALGLG